MSPPVMVLRFSQFQPVLVLLALLAVATRGLAAPALATNPALTFFSSLSEEPLARLEAAAIAPRYVRHGPFRVPAPGVEIESPTLALHDQPCTPDDWARLLKELSAWRQLPGASDFLLTLPDGRSFTFLRAPSISETTFSGFVRPLAADHAKTAAPLLLRIAHDGAQRLRVDLRPLPPAPVSAAVPAEPADAPISAPAPETTSPPPSTPDPATEPSPSPAKNSPSHATAQP